LELFRASQAKIDKQQSGLLTIDERDKELRLVLAAENKLHPALFSAEAEHKVDLFIFCLLNLQSHRIYICCL
jgi:sorting nexin-13